MMTDSIRAMHSATSPVRRCYAALLLLVGVALIVGGAILLACGGSAYYVLEGLAVALSGVLIWRAHPGGRWLYAASLVLSITWAVAEVGFDGWGLIARLAVLVALGVPLLFPGLAFLQSPPTRKGAKSGWRAETALTAVAIAGGMLIHSLVSSPAAIPLTAHGLQSQAPALLAQPLASNSRQDWAQYGNDAGGTRFSPLTDITPQNINQLKVAWEADTGPTDPSIDASLEVTPINIGDALYLCNAYNDVISLDAETGHERWRYRMSPETALSGKPCRGVAYFQLAEATGLCAERILATSQAPELYALDAATGKPCPGFGASGRVVLTQGMGNVPFGYVSVTSAPQIIRGRAVIGGGVVDGQFWGEPSGVIRAFDAVTGRLAWAFDARHPQNHGVPEDGESYTPSTPNSWAPISADEALGLVYIPMGNSSPDFFGGMRRPFDDEYSSAVVALDANSGEPRWRFQTVHHDIWDYDVPSQPTLVDLPTARGVQHALIQTTKRGQIFVLDRETGEPIKPVSELAVPQGGIAPGERLSATQPFSTEMPSLRAASLTEKDMWGLSPIDQMICRIEFKRSRYEGEFTPPTLDRPMIFTPGFGGGAEWGGVTVNVDRGVMVVNWNTYASRVRLMTRAEADAQGFKRFDGHGQGNGMHPMQNTPYAAQADVTFMSPLNVPCTAPPWGYITAIDLASGKVIWNDRFGSGRDSGPFAIPSQIPVTMGVPNIGGAISTRSGLVFIAATAERTIRAYDITNGKELWHDRLPGGGQATPMTYRSPASGRQFVVIAAGGKPRMSKLGTKIVAYALAK